MEASDSMDTGTIQLKNLQCKFAWSSIPELLPCSHKDEEDIMGSERHLSQARISAFPTLSAGSPNLPKKSPTVVYLPFCTPPLHSTAQRFDTLIQAQKQSSRHHHMV